MDEKPNFSHLVQSHPIDSKAKSILFVASLLQKKREKKSNLK